MGSVSDSIDVMFCFTISFFSFVSRKLSTGAEDLRDKSTSAIYNAAVITNNVQTRSIRRDLPSEDERPQRGAELTDSRLASRHGYTSLPCFKVWFLEQQSLSAPQWGPH